MKTQSDKSMLYNLKTFFSKDATMLDIASTAMPKKDATLFIPYVHQRLLPLLEAKIVKGPDAGRTFEIQAGKNTFGRDQKNKICFQDSSISSAHGTIEYSKKAGIVVYDMASRNGISLNGKVSPVLKVKHGDIVQIGSTYIQIGKSKTKDVIKKIFTARNVFIVSSCAVLFGAGALLLTKSKPMQIKVPAVERAQQKQILPELKSKPMPRVSRTRPVQKPMNLVPSRLAAADEAIQAGEYANAFVIYQDVSKFDPTNTIAHEGLENLNRIAARLIEEAMMISDSDVAKASQKIDMAMKITDSKSEIFEKAQTLAKKLRKA